MAESYIQLPVNNTGSKLRTEQRVIGANTIEEQYVRESVSPTYRVFTGEITMGLTAVRTPVITLWHPSASSVTARIKRIMMHMRVGHTAGTLHVKTQFITAENGTPGGTTLTPQQMNRASAASALTVRQAPAAPTRTGQLLDDYTKTAVAITGGVEQSSYVLYKSEGESITLRGGIAEGIEVSTDTLAALTGAPIFVLGVEWTEE